MTLRNHTSHPAQFVVHRGQQVIGRFPAIAPGELIELPAGSRVLGFNYDTGERYFSLDEYFR